MRISDLESQFGYTAVQDSYEDQPIESVYTSDLLSDVMAHAESSALLITIQAHKNTIAVCTLADIGAVLVCNSRPIPEDMIEAAREEHIAIFRSSESQFVASGRIYEKLS